MDEPKFSLMTGQRRELLQRGDPRKTQAVEAVGESEQREFSI
jgi:hypothetical protein